MPTRGIPIETLDVADVARLKDAGKLLLIDVREPSEYASERIAGALLYPLSTFDAAALPTDGSRRVVFHCGSGKRSLTAAERCIEAGRHEPPTWLAGSQRGRPQVCRWPVPAHPRDPGHVATRNVTERLHDEQRRPWTQAPTSSSASFAGPEGLPEYNHRASARKPGWLRGAHRAARSIAQSSKSLLFQGSRLRQAPLRYRVPTNRRECRQQAFLIECRRFDRGGPTRSRCDKTR
jgi:rhodanese-related sulfurtransferase